MRRSWILLVALALLLAPGWAGPADATTPPQVTSLTTDPASLSAAGGPLTVQATVTNATTCVFTTSPDLGSSPAPVSCTGGSFRRTVTIPQNTSTTDTVSYTFTVKAQSSAGFQTRSVTLVQSTQQVPGPMITSLSAAPASLPSSGGKATIRAAITNGATCTFTKDVALGGGTVTTSCTSTYARTVTIPANTSTTTSQTYSFTLEVDNPSGSATGSIGVVEAAASNAPPTITGFAASPSSFGSGGGTASLTASLANATNCALTVPAALGGTTTTSDCSAGAFQAGVTLPADTGSSAATYSFTLQATGPGGTATQTISVTVAGTGSPTLTDLTVTPATLTSDGGTARLRATVANATQCTFTLPASLGGRSRTSDCSGGSFVTNVSVPANTTSSAQSYVYTLTATGPGGSVTGSYTITVPAANAPGPSVGALTSDPATISATGGPLTISGTVAGASTCTLTSSPATRGLSSAPFDCSAGGTISRTVTIPANNTSAAHQYSFTLVAHGTNGTSAGSTIVLGQNPSPPVVTALHSSPATIPAAGATITLTSSVKRATSCRFSSAPDAGVDESPFACSGAVSRTVTIPANSTGSPITYDFGLTASGPGGTAGRGLTITQPAQ